MAREFAKINDEADLIAKYRIPLTAQRVSWLAAAVAEHPEHVITIEPPFLVLRTPSEVGGDA